MRLNDAFDRLTTLGPVLGDAAIRGAIVLLAALAITHMLRRKNAAVRHLIWVGAVLVQLLLPLFALWGPRWNVAVPQLLGVVPGVTVVASTPATADTPSLVATIPESMVSASPTTGPLRPQPKAAVSITRAQLLAALWAVGAFVVLARLAIGTTVVARLARRGNRIDDGNWLSLAQRLSNSLKIDRPLTLMRGDRLGVPVTWGIVYPVVLLPEDADAWPEERRRFVLVHEMAHVKRLDALTQLAGQLALAVFWFNPLVWIANRRMQLEREHACDDYVIRHGTAPSMYAEELLSMVRSLGEPNHRSAQPAFAALAMARRSEFEGRMLSILDPVLDRHPLSKSRTLVSGALALLLVVPLAALQPYQKADVVKTVVSAPPASSVGASVPKPNQSVDEFPKSFKVNIAPAESGGATWQKFPTTTLATISGPGGAKSCDSVTSSTLSRSTSIHANDDGQNVITLRYLSYNAEMCASAKIIGKLTYAPDETDILEMPAGSQAAFSERNGGGERELIVMSSPSDPAAHVYRRNGATATYDEDARRWFAGFLPRVLMETGVNVAPRVAHWKQEGGVDGVIAHIAKLNSSSAKRSHYLALIDQGGLNTEDLEKVVNGASATIRNSSSDLRAVLTRAMPRGQVTNLSVPAFERAISGLTYSTDKAAVAQMYAQTDNREMLLAVIRGINTITSNGDRARTLQTLASRYLTKNDRELERAYFESADSISSSGDRRNVLMIAMPFAASSANVAARIIASTLTIVSSGDRAAVLIALAHSGALVNRSLKDSFFDAASAIPSQGDRARVLQSAAGIKQ
jgi:beta-lactamase regulating signal transducer with metallopeptidase domain